MHVAALLHAHRTITGVNTDTRDQVTAFERSTARLATLRKRLDAGGENDRFYRFDRLYIALCLAKSDCGGLSLQVLDQ